MVVVDIFVFFKGENIGRGPSPISYFFYFLFSDFSQTIQNQLQTHIYCTAKAVAMEMPTNTLSDKINKLGNSLKSMSGVG